MPSIRITAFGGLNTEVSARNKSTDAAQIAHNCLLWDGSLRPMAKWIKMAVPVSQGAQSIYTYKTVDPNSLEYQEYIKTNTHKDIVLLDTFMHPSEILVGLGEDWKSSGQANIVFTYANAENDEYRHIELYAPVVSGGSVTYSAANQSDKPVNRMYGISYLDLNNTVESPITVLPGQDVTKKVFEGDIANISFSLSDHPFSPGKGYGFSGMGIDPRVKLYRTISALETGHSANNEVATEWHLVTTLSLRSLSFSDDGQIQGRSYETYTQHEFLPPPPSKYDNLSIAESGRLVVSGKDGKVAISEMEQFHAYPTENYYKLPNVRVTDMVVSYNNIYIGTQTTPYLLEMTDADTPLEVNIAPYSAVYPCIPNTMDKTGAGAIYASSAGVVALTPSGMKLLTSGIGHGILPMYISMESLPASIQDEFSQMGMPTTFCKDIRFRDTVYGAYYDGSYLGICGFERPADIISDGPIFSPAPPGSNQHIQYVTVYKGYLYDTGSSIDGDRPYQRLITFDAPQDEPKDHIRLSSGLALLCSRDVYTMPFPDTDSGDDYFNAPKMCYSWKSKKFVLPGSMTFSAAKVVHDCDGFVRLKIYADCECRYETEISGCRPFRLPPHVVGVEWEVELVGTATVHEVHLASSMKELLER